MMPAKDYCRWCGRPLTDEAVGPAGSIVCRGCGESVPLPWPEIPLIRKLQRGRLGLRGKLALGAFALALAVATGLWALSHFRREDGRMETVAATLPAGGDEKPAPSSVESPQEKVAKRSADSDAAPPSAGEAEGPQAPQEPARQEKPKEEEAKESTPEKPTPAEQPHRPEPQETQKPWEKPQTQAVKPDAPAERPPAHNQVASRQHPEAEQPPNKTQERAPTGRRPTERSPETQRPDTPRPQVPEPPTLETPARLPAPPVRQTTVPEPQPEVAPAQLQETAEVTDSKATGERTPTQPATAPQPALRSPSISPLARPPAEGQGPPVASRPPAQVPPSAKAPESARQAGSAVTDHETGLKTALPLVPRVQNLPMPAIPSSLGQIVVSQGSPVASMGFSPDTKWLVTGHEDGAFVIWDAATGARANRVDAASTAITRVVFSPGGDLLVTTSADGQVRLWDTGLWRPARKDLLLPRALAIAFSPTGEAFVCAQESGRIGIIRLDGLPSGYLRGHDNPALAAAFGLDGRTLVTGGADNTLRIWDVSGPKAVERRCLGHNDWVERVVVSRGGHVFSSAADHTIRVWDAEKAEAIGQLAEFDVPILDMAADRAGDCVAIANADGAVHVLDAASGREIERLVSPIRSVGATAVAFSPDGKWLAAGFKNGRVEMWSTADWAARKPSRPTTTPVPSAPETLELAQTAKYYDLMRQADELREGAKLDEAAGLYARAAELQPDSVVPLESLGDVYRRMESWQNALGVYRKMLELRPGAISIRLSLCDIQSALGNHEEAIAELQRIVGESPTLATPRLRLGFAYGKMERWPEAADAFKRALELAPESHEAHYGLGLALLKQNQFDAAVASLRRALALNVSEPNTYAALIYCCLSRNPPDIRSARKLVEQAEEAKVALPSALLESLRSPGAQ